MTANLTQELLTQIKEHDEVAYAIVVKLNAVFGGLQPTLDSDGVDGSDGRIVLLGSGVDDVGNEIKIHVYGDSGSIIEIEHVLHNSYWLSIDKDYNLDMDGDTTLQLIKYILEDILTQARERKVELEKRVNEIEHDVLIEED